ncbi:MAG: hypothetical protein FWE91_12920 [Defluviitaleaceae bacterium]|nr:hypothetical protein [Defluviitaleaceae bacterium]
MQKSSFWLSAGATAGIVVLAFLDWITVGEGRWAENFNLFSSWSQMNEIRSELSRWFGSVPGEITGIWLLLSVLAVLLLLSVILQIVALVKQHSGEDGAYWIKFAYWGYGLSIVVPLGYIIAAIYVNDGSDSVNPTAFFILTCVAAIVGIVSSKNAAS